MCSSCLVHYCRPRRIAKKGIRETYLPPAKMGFGAKPRVRSRSQEFEVGPSVLSKQNAEEEEEEEEDEEDEDYEDDYCRGAVVVVAA